MAPIDSRSWMISLLLRSVALFTTVIAIILFGVGFSIGMGLWIILYSIVAVWSLVEFILLLCKRIPHPGVNVGLDLVSCLITGIMGIIGCASFLDIGLYYTNLTAVRVGVVLGLVAAVTHFVLFVRACVHTHRRRYASSKVDWEANQMNHV